VAAWRDAPYFNDAARAALALTEAVTRLSDRPDPVPDEIWKEAARHYDERALGALLIAIATVNVWNRLNVATKQVAGEWLKSSEGRASLESHAAAR
jgi:alkylhydroperoxidase family enzyme